MSFIERAVEHLKPDGPVPDAHGGEQVARKSDDEARGPFDGVRCREDGVIRIDRALLRAEGVIGPESEEYRISEEYRLIKRPLLRMVAEGKSPERNNVVSVSSALPGDGKTFTCINLALSLAVERDREIVLIDGDVAKRHLTRIFDLDEAEGLLDAASADRTDLSRIMWRTDLPSLCVVPAGSRHIEATEILSSKRAASVMNALGADPRRIVLIDTAPLLAASEATAIVSIAGQVLLVVKAGETPQDALGTAIEMIPEEKPIALVLNQVLSGQGGRYGGYYDYDSYDRYGGSGAKESNNTSPRRTIGT